MTEQELKEIAWSKLNYVKHEDGTKAIFIYANNPLGLENALRNIGFTMSLHKEPITQLIYLKLNFNNGGYIRNDVGLSGIEPIDWLINGEIKKLYVISNLDNSILPPHHFHPPHLSN